MKGMQIAPATTAAAVSLFAAHYNFCRVHEALTAGYAPSKHAGHGAWDHRSCMVRWRATGRCACGRAARAD